MELILIRHGQPDYSEVTERKYIGHGRSLAKLTKLGKEQAEKVSKDERLKGVDIFLWFFNLKCIKKCAKHTFLLSVGRLKLRKID